jgi:pimeloyl-ACP methyl ester carboxylesterase
MLGCHGSAYFLGCPQPIHPANVKRVMERQTLFNSLAIAGAALGASAMFNQWSASRAEAKYPPLGRIIEVDGVNLHFFEKGEGSPIVLLHGSGSLVQDMTVSGLVDRLAERHRVIVFDRPGYGWSSRPAGRDWSPAAQAALFAAAAEQSGAERPLLFGHSWGTLPAIAWALDRPADVRGLVLAAGYYFPTPRPDALFTAILASPVLGDLVAHTIAPLQTRLTGPAGFRMIFSPSETPQRFLDEMPFALMLRPIQLHATAADSATMPIAAAALEPRYGELTLPVTIIWGEGDKLVDQANQSARLAELLPTARAVPLADVGHMVHQVALDEVVAAIDATV